MVFTLLAFSSIAKTRCCSRIAWKPAEGSNAVAVNPTDMALRVGFFSCPVTGKSALSDAGYGNGSRQFPPSSLVRAAGLEPAQALELHELSYRFGFRRRSSGAHGLDYLFTLAMSL